MSLTFDPLSFILQLEWRGGLITDQSCLLIRAKDLFFVVPQVVADSFVMMMMMQIRKIKVLLGL